MAAMMPRRSLLAALLLVVLCVSTYGSVAAEEGAAVPSPVVVDLRREGEEQQGASPKLARFPHEIKETLYWSVEDTVLWMTHTVGYPEYASLLRIHRVDGVTLLAMTGADFENFFPIESPIHAIKIEAHLRLIAKRCRCLSADDKDQAAASSSSYSLWQNVRTHQRATLVLGFSVTHFPRATMLFAHYFYPHVYDELMNAGKSGALAPVMNAFAEGAASAAGMEDQLEDEVEEPPAAEPLTQRLRWWLARLCVVLWPDLFFAYQCIAYVQASYVVMPLCAVHFIFQAVAEAHVVYNLVKRTSPLLSEPLWRWPWFLYGLDPVIPLLGWVISFSPFRFIVYLAIVALMLWIVFLQVATVAAFFIYRADAQGGAAEGAAAAAGEGGKTSSEEAAATGASHGSGDGLD